MKLSMTAHWCAVWNTVGFGNVLIKKKHPGVYLAVLNGYAKNAKDTIYTDGPLAGSTY